MNEIEIHFPNLSDTLYRLTSPADKKYNCIGWAAGDAYRWWEPDSFKIYFWPKGAPRERTLAAYIIAFESLGYEPCQSGKHEPGQEKVVIYCDGSGVPTHAARQLPDGKWTSKCGSLEDISHTLAAFDRSSYGRPAAFLMRPLPQIKH